MLPSSSRLISVRSLFPCWAAAAAVNAKIVSQRNILGDPADRLPELDGTEPAGREWTVECKYNFCIIQQA